MLVVVFCLVVVGGVSAKTPFRPSPKCPNPSAASLNCGVNEVAVECATVAPPQTCESIYTLYRPVEDIPCTPGCDCRPGYLRNKANICIPSEFCPTTPQNQCGPYQEYKKCGTSCEPSCSDLDNPIIICTDQCVSGCFCIEGYYKDEQGNCIPKDDCPLPICNKPNEVAKGCGSYCEMRTCEDYKRTDIVCPAVCVRGCFCLDGYVRNAYGVCVLPDQCLCLQENEEYQSCGSSCPDNCDNYLDKDRICTMNCVSGCNCKPGFVRNLQDMTCVKPEQCQPICPAGEKFNECSAHCQDTCENYDKPNRICTYQCQSGCVCDAGTVRRQDGKCVAPSECKATPTCSSTEVYSPCSAHCEPTCESSAPGVVARPCTRNCVPGCKCAEGLVRRKDRQCVKLEECSAPPECGQNSQYTTCGTACPLTCENYNNPPQVCTAQCVEGCFCEPGFVKDSNQRCVKPEECLPQCPANERYVNCVLGLCVPKTCDQLGFPVACPSIAGPCEGGCVCADNYLRNSDGVCIPQENCPSCGGDFNATAGCGTNCGRLCSNYDKNVNCAVPLLCLFNACDCKQGYVHDSVSHRCVAPTDCLTPECGQNSQYTTCGTACPLTCENYNNPPQACTAQCVEGCFCEPGFVKDSNQRCVKPEECPAPVCGQNEQYTTCGTACPLTCENYNNPSQVCTDQCVQGCFCEPGFVKDSNQRCVKPEECPINKTCSDPNAERVECASPCQSTCATPDPGPCILSCKLNSCVCKKGYVLSEKEGKCVAVDQCPKDAPCNGDSNAVIKVNPIPCPSTCASPNASPYCKKYAPPLGCECKPGYLKSSDDFDGKCIKPEECTGGNPCGINGTFVWCKAGCPTDYCPVNDNRGIIACSPPYPCPNGCACKLNYRKKSNKDETCILASDCPSINCTRPNEIYSSCPSACLAENCADVNNQPRTCNTLVFNCQPQCICKKGYFRNDNGICIPADQCPNQPCSDPNAERVVCPSQCQPTCAQPNPGPCILSCNINTCVCKKGFILSEDGGTCIPVDKCPSDAPCNGDSNAVIKANPIPCPSTCSSPYASPYCKKYAPPVGCECKPGYIQSDVDGKCIKPDDCKGGNPCGPNGNFVSCYVNCPTNNCPVNDNRGILICDPAYPCPSGCACKPNYKKRSSQNNTCILAPNCPPIDCTRPNEIYSSCPSACLAENCADVNNQPSACNTLVLNCQPQCICKEGHFRNDKDICVPANQCPGVTTQYRQNEQYTTCGTACPRTCQNYKSPPQICTQQCVEGYFCKAGFVRDSDQRCVRPEECSNNQVCSDPNSERLACAPQARCRVTCANPTPGPCPKICVLNDCVCKKGFVLSEEGGKCIPVGQCPTKVNCGPNEVYQPSSIVCPPQTCESIYTDYDCQNAAKNVPGCDCISGYLRNGTVTDPCIPSDQCPNPGGTPSCGLNEHYETNRIKCDATCEIKNIQAPIGPCSATSGCFCDDGFYRNTNGICVTSEQCPPRTCLNPNEVFDECPSDCPSVDKCSNMWVKVDCSKREKCCKPQCRCKDGYLRKDNGVCVPSQQCIGG